MKTLLALFALLATLGLSACKQQPAEAPAPVVQEPAAPAPSETTETGNPAATEGVAPAAPAATPASK